MTAPLSLELAAEIRAFWIDRVGPAGWYAVDADLDAEIRDRFAGPWEVARAGGARAWLTLAEDTLALLILLDQFPRNMFRGTARAFASDGAARAAAIFAVDLGHDLRVPEPERQFFYLPLMHSESLTHQERCLRLVLMRMPEAGAENRIHGFKHRDVIRRFGRFPSRNAALGRRDTDEERAYRAAGGYMG
ncbi:DUF924 family protein [Paralimibaculum aggregatum]|uniref:DUF924 family protein n=1 Tax=Paralimibaculum aggregatum TaxID=3036245 RepID=A0ABQ6LQH1_9RHOB|nr:DUF924 family protein [Limibaculum sp. NKW23]GMG83333.1 DUF924 family protein [Limibaculum sp. NKW23]